MKHGVLLLVCLLSAQSVFANDQADQQALLQFTVENSPECASLSIDVPQSIIVQDGQVILRQPAAIALIQEDVRVQNQIQNCLARVENAVQRFDAENDLSPTLTNRLKQAASRFVIAISALVQSNKNPGIQRGPIATIGIRG